MSDVKITFEDDEYVEYEFTQPNDLLGDTYYWEENDWVKWKQKMDDLEKLGTKGEDETFRIKLKKNPFLDGSQYLGRNTGADSETNNTRENDQQGSEV